MMFVRDFSAFGRLCGGLGMYSWGGIALWAVLVAAVILIVILATRKNRKARPDDALEALKLRYIKGELSEEDYLKMKETLGK